MREECHPSLLYLGGSSIGITESKLETEKSRKYSGCVQPKASVDDLEKNHSRLMFLHGRSIYSLCGELGELGVGWQGV